MHENFIRCDHKLENGAQCEERHRSDLGRMGGLPEGWVTVQRHIRVTPEQALGRSGFAPEMMDAVADAAAKLGDEAKGEKTSDMVDSLKASMGEMAMKMSPTRCVQSHLCPSHAPALSVVDAADPFEHCAIGSPYCG